MTLIRLSAVSAVLLAALVAAGCANTIRGIGQDTANALDATQQAGRNIVHAAN